MARSTGDTLEALVRRSATLFAAEGLRLKQTGATFRGKIGPRGQAKGRIVSKGDLDFVGDYRGRSVSFDAKSTTNATSFPLKNLKRHQVTICKNAHARGAMAFFLVEFSLLEVPAYFALTWPELKSFWQRYDAIAPGTTYTASIPLPFFLGHCVRIERQGNVLDLPAAIIALQVRMDSQSA